MPIFRIDLPNWIDPEGEWKHIEDFESREAALKFAQEVLGADEEGRIHILSNVLDEDADPDWKEIAQTELRNAVDEAFKDFSSTTMAVTVNNVWCHKYEDLVINLVALADDIHSTSQTPEEFHADEAGVWAESALQKFDQHLLQLKWAEQPNGKD